MKKKNNKTTGVSKGAPSGFVISLMVHAAAFLLAGMLVVFNVVQKEEKKFVPPKPVDRPKMKLKKPKVKVKKSSKPKTTQRIVTKVKRASMPDIQLPEMSGIGDSLGGDLGGFDLMPTIEEGGLFGDAQTVGNDFVGTFYDFNRSRNGSATPMDPDTFFEIVKKFVINDWRTSALARFYRSPQKLYTTSISIPTCHSTMGPMNFGEDSNGWCWMVHYKGQLVYHEDTKIRFWGQGDDLLLVRVNGELVLNACWPGWADPYFAPLWSSSSADNRKHPLGNNRSAVGDWIELKAGEPVDMEIIIGEGPGGLFEALMTVEVEGEEYPKNEIYFGPKLPLFRTEAFTRNKAEAIMNRLYPTDASVTNGPVFKDYASAPKTYDISAPEPTQPTSLPEEINPLRAWTSISGKVLEAEYVTLMGKEVVLKSKRGKQIKMPLTQLSLEDREFLDLANPPKFKIDFTKSTTMVPPPDTTPFLDQAPRPMRIQDYTFGVRLRQTDNRIYDHDLKVEYFAVAAEVDGSNYILVDRQEVSFNPSQQEKRTFIHKSEEPSRIVAEALRDVAPMRGAKYDGFLIVVSDKTGRIVQYKASHEHLYRALDKLRVFPLKRHFDENGDRTWPPRPTEGDRPTWNW